MTKARSIYIHFPFCETKCHYCDFYSLGVEKTKPNDPLLFLNSLLEEIQIKSKDIAPLIDTLFLGGGTPSMTSPSDMKKIFDSLWRFTKLSDSYEWTMEANPSSIGKANVSAYSDIGVNRISLGVQALRDALLADLGRVHDTKSVFTALDSIFNSPIQNVSVDLLCGVPDQSFDDIKNAIDRLTQYPITHLSCYLLTLPKSHRMFKSLPNDELQQGILLLVHDELTKRGFTHYEISNFCKPGFEAKHNLSYWKNHSYLGFGPSAHSFDQELGVRSKNVSSLHQYATKIKNGDSPVDHTESLSNSQKELEKWLLALRLSEGFPKKWISTENKIKNIEAFIKSGHIESHPANSSHYRLTPLGFTVSDSIILKLS